MHQYSQLFNPGDLVRNKRRYGSIAGVGAGEHGYRTYPEGTAMLVLEVMSLTVKREKPNKKAMTRLVRYCLCLPAAAGIDERSGEPAPHVRQEFIKAKKLEKVE